ncbi:hypothetical protein HK102_002156 [Quaeritorhiza haematococci]|nr:hypothetical protein HK102_002156 [Quaeritorhiza haematococci]
MASRFSSCLALFVLAALLLVSAASAAPTHNQLEKRGQMGAYGPPAPFSTVKALQPPPTQSPAPIPLDDDDCEDDVPAPLPLDDEDCEEDLDLADEDCEEDEPEELECEEFLDDTDQWDCTEEVASINEAEFDCEEYVDNFADMDCEEELDPNAFDCEEVPTQTTGSNSSPPSSSVRPSAGPTPSSSSSPAAAQGEGASSTPTGAAAQAQNAELKSAASHIQTTLSSYSSLFTAFASITLGSLVFLL